MDNWTHSFDLGTNVVGDISIYAAGKHSYYMLQDQKISAQQ